MYVHTYIQEWICRTFTKVWFQKATTSKFIGNKYAHIQIWIVTMITDNIAVKQNYQLAQSCSCSANKCWYQGVPFNISQLLDMQSFLYEHLCQSWCIWTNQVMRCGNAENHILLLLIALSWKLVSHPVFFQIPVALYYEGYTIFMVFTYPTEGFQATDEFI